MLVLSRRVGEKIYIGDDVWIMVTGIDRGRVRIGVVAPDKPIVRAELVDEEREPEKPVE